MTVTMNVTRLHHPKCRGASSERRGVAGADASLEPRESGRRAPTDSIRSPCSSNRTRTREPDLVPVRHGRMMVSPFTFYRGAAKIMAADLEMHA